MANIRRLPVALAAMAVVLAQPWPGSSAADTEQLTISSVSVVPARVTPSGITPETVAISVGLSSSVPIDIWCNQMLVGQTSPTVQIERTTAADPHTDGNQVPESYTALLTLTSGTETHGVWTASVSVPSTWTGSWEVSRVSACPYAPSPSWIPPIEIDPRTIGISASLTVAGTHLPRLSAGTVPNPLALNATSFTAKGRLYDSETNTGLPGVRLHWCGTIHGAGGLEPPKETCTGTYYLGDSWAGYIDHPIVTNASGYWSVTWPNDGYYREIDLWTRPPGGSEQNGILPPKVLTRAPAPVIIPVISATPAKAVLAAGSPLAVSGKWFGKYGCSAQVRNAIQLQYLYGSTAWRTITTTTNRTSGRWDAVYPARLGRAIYRAYYAGVPGSCTPAATASFVVTGT